MPDLLNPLNLFALGFEILIKSLFALAIIKTLNEISEKNRKIVPGLVWLLVIPGFNVIWNFFVALRLSQSLKDELDERDFEVAGKPTLIIGLAYALISASALFIPQPKNVQDVQNGLLYGVLGIAAIVTFVQYWMKINWFKKVLQNDSVENDGKDQL
ncbi:MAG TPA: hypothetical protein VF602_03740 [Pedobacter sp.]|jgi:hypothetical protein